MKTQNQITKMPWDQSEFEKLKSGWSPERIAEDEKRLQEIFNMAADSPTMKRALDWATAHGIKFFIDRTCVNVAGYYTLGTGVFAIAERYAHPSDFAVEVITHELRHAWQDYHGFLGGLNLTATTNFSEYFIQLSLIEADAFAFGQRAAEEICASSRRKLPEDYWRSPPPMIASLGGNFLGWFANASKTQFYGDAASKSFGKASEIYKGPAPARSYEFMSSLEKTSGTGVDTENLEDVLRLGVGFSRKNYLAKLSRDVLLKKILRPQLANSFYNAANGNQKKLTAELRKCYLRKKFPAETAAHV